MSDTIIKVENISKKYIISHQAKQQGYKTLRDSLSKSFKSFGHRLAHPLRRELRASEEEFWALKDISFEVKQGDRVGIIGRNGAGKSTLLKILSRITEPTSGKISIKGRIGSLLEVGTGFHPELSGRENIYLNGSILGMSRIEIKKKFDEIVAFAEIEKFLDTPVKRYSSGMYVRLAFAVAAHLEPEVLIIDEVLAVGDAAFQKKCIEKMESISTQNGKTILFVSHQPAFLMRLCTRGVLLNEGNILFQGEIKETVNRYLNDKNDEKRFVWEKLSSRLPFSEIFEPKKFFISDHEGNPTNKINEVDFFYAQVEVEIHKPDPRIGCSIAFYDDKNMLLFTSDLYDFFPPEKVATLSGKIKFCIELPRNLFLPKTYSVELIAFLHWSGWVLPPDNQSRISFSFLPKQEKNWYAGDARLGSLFYPIQWKIEG